MNARNFAIVILSAAYAGSLASAQNGGQAPPPAAAAQAPAPAAGSTPTGNAGKGSQASGASSTTKKTTKTTTTTTSSANAVKWTDLVNGGKLPYGNNVSITGQLSDLKCGNKSISDVLDITAVSVSYLGQTSQAAAATITSSSSSWTVPMASLPADTAVNLQMKITGKISAKIQNDIASQLLTDAQFLASIKTFSQMTVHQSPTIFSQQAQWLLGSISDKNGPLTGILQDLLPSCAVTSDVTAAAVVGLRANNEVDLLGLPTRLDDMAWIFANLKIDGYQPTMSPSQLYDFVQKGPFTSGGKPLLPKDSTAVAEQVKVFTTSWNAVVSAFAGDVVAQLSQGVQLSNVSTDTQDLNKYAGFDVGALYAPRINELRQYDMVHIYPWGPVELGTNGDVPFRQRWSIAVGVSVGDLSGNGSSRIKSDKAFVYGVGFRFAKYFRISAGAMLYRDAVGNRLLNEAFIGPSIDITALPALKTVFSSSSSKSNTTTKTATTTVTTPTGSDGTPPN
jgi:hypothetical protein